MATSASFSPPLVRQDYFRTQGYIGTLCRVSYAWRCISLSCPSLWADIDAYPGINRDRLTFLVERAPPLPMSLSVREKIMPQTGPAPSSSEGIAAIRQILLEHGSNIRMLIFSGKPQFLEQCVAIAVMSNALRTIRIINRDMVLWRPTSFDVMDAAHRVAGGLRGRLRSCEPSTSSGVTPP
jgi:hypothetical protein